MIECARGSVSLNRVRQDPSTFAHERETAELFGGVVAHDDGAVHGARLGPLTRVIKNHQSKDILLRSDTLMRVGIK